MKEKNQLSSDNLNKLYMDESLVEGYLSATNYE